MNAQNDIQAIKTALTSWLSSEQLPLTTECNNIEIYKRIKFQK